MLNLAQQQTAMFQAGRIGQMLYYGFDEGFFYLRLDLFAKPEAIELHFLQPSEVRVVATDKGGDGAWRVVASKARTTSTSPP